MMKFGIRLSGCQFLHSTLSARCNRTFLQNAELVFQLLISNMVYSMILVIQLGAYFMQIQWEQTSELLIFSVLFPYYYDTSTNFREANGNVLVNTLLRCFSPPPRRLCLRRCLSVCLSVSNFAQKLRNGFAGNCQGRLAMGQLTNAYILVAIWISVQIQLQGLFSGFVNIWRYATLQCWAGIAIATMTSLRHQPLAEVCTVPVLLVICGITVIY